MSNDNEQEIEVELDVIPPVFSAEIDDEDEPEQWDTVDVMSEGPSIAIGQQDAEGISHLIVISPSQAQTLMTMLDLWLNNYREEA
jgi:hypothetical protein